MGILNAGALYFALVFGAGFVLGPIRVLWAVPRFGARTAELLEMPVMFVVIVLAARWTSRRLGSPTTASRRLGVGIVALAFLLVTELTVVLSIRGLTIDEYVAHRDPVAGTAYILMLGVYPFMPLISRNRTDRSGLQGR